MESLALMPKYEAYKDSYSDYSGLIPCEWKLIPIRAIFEERNEKNTGPKTDHILSVTRDRGVIPYDEKGAIGNNKSEDIERYKLVYENDLVINKMNVVIGSLGLSKYFGALSQVYIVLRPKTKSFNIRYYAYLFHNEPFYKSLIRYCTGIMELRESLNKEQFKQLYLPFPTFEEQTLIANFLDKKTAQIDDAIAIKEQQISLLKERKQIIIQQAVTQGLDPNVPVKDSGVDWIGKIPAHWEVLPLTKYSTRVDYRGKTPEKVELGRFLLTAKNIKNGYIDYDASKEYIREEQYEKVMSRGKPRIGDLLFTTEAPLGSTALVDDTSVAIAQRLILFRLSRRFVSGYVNLYMQTTMFQNFLQKLGTGSTALGIKASKFCFLKLVTPPEKEQLSIFQFSEKVSNETNSAIAVLHQQIDKLKEYKTALINSAVTGKIKITPEMVEQ